jgi:hypothetical protein
MENTQNSLVAIVDDDERNIFALSSYLQASGMQTMVAKNGKELLDQLDNNTIPKPNIILLDMMMPVMDGYETLGFLKLNSTYKEIPVIAVTAKAMKGDKEKCIDAGAWDYLPKPINVSLLNEKLRQWIK